MTNEFILNEEEALKSGFEEARRKGKLFNIKKWKLQRENERPSQDKDSDGVPNGFDCEPNNPDKQDKWKNKFNLKGKSKVNSILNKIMKK